ncbi:MAG: hypothetical protein JXQ75_23145 [Phycisphaerae bacterium]|nr:hypothetical protein [Phycisphaerae bacterium]
MNPRPLALAAGCVWLVALLLTTGRESRAAGRWVSCGPYGGSTAVLLPSHHPEGGLYAAVLGHGVYRRCSTADVWERRSDGLGNLFVKALVQNPDEPDILYAGTRDGVYWTTDGGLHWEPRTQGIGGGVHVEALAIDPNNPQILYAERWGEIYKTVNAGETWEPSGPGIPGGLDCPCILVDPSNDDVVYAGMHDPYGPSGQVGVYKSVNGGAEWFESASGLLNNQVQCLTFDPTSSQTIYAGTNGNQYVPYGGVYVSHDAGANWTWISNGLPSDNILSAIAVVYEDDTDIPVLYAAGSYGYDLPQPPGTWESRLYKSVDGGESWQRSASGLAFPNFLSVVVDPADPHVVYAGSECGGVFQSTDSAENWAHWSTGLERLHINSLVVHPLDEDIVYAATDSYLDEFSPAGAGVYVSFDGGLNWEPRPKDIRVGDSLSIASVAVALCDPETIYAANCGWMLYKSIDEGRTWQWRGWSNGIDGYWLKCVVVDPVNPQVAYVSGAGYEPSYPDIYKTEDCGESWRPVASYIVWAEFMGLAIDPTDTQVVYAGSGWEGVWKTTNGGSTWDATGPEINSAMVNSIVVDPQHPQHVYAGDNQWESTGVYVSYNGGGQWERYNEGLDNLDVESLAIDSVVTGDEYPVTLYAGTEGGGVFRRGDADTWEEMNNGLEDRRAYAVALGPPRPGPDPAVSNRVIYAGTASGAYRWIQLGDMNDDGKVGLEDIELFIVVLLGLDTDPYHVTAADMDGSGTPDGNDIQPFVNAMLGG